MFPFVFLAQQFAFIPKFLQFTVWSLEYTIRKVIIIILTKQRGWQHFLMDIKKNLLQGKDVSFGTTLVMALMVMNRECD